jgi:hypothetical protein
MDSVSIIADSKALGRSVHLPAVVGSLIMPL